MPRIVGRGLKNLAWFSGRDNRPQFWWYLLVVYGASIIIDLIVSFAVLGPATTDPAGWLERRRWAEAWDILGTLILVVLLAAAVVRRLHDANRSGWWALLPVPTSVAAFLWVHDLSPVEFDLSFVSIFILINAAAVIALVVLLAQPGIDGPNRFGPDPGS